MTNKPTGCIETMLIRDGQIPLLPYHIDRLHRSIAAIAPSYIIDDTLLEREVAIYLEPGHSLVLRAEWVAQYPELMVMSTRNIPDIASSYTVAVVPYRAKINGAYSWIKSRDRSAYQIALEEAKKWAADDALLVNNEGNIMETTIANILYAIGDQYYTPPLIDGGVAGVKRAYILEHGHEGVLVLERSLHISELNEVKELWAMNAVRGVFKIKLVG